MPLPAESVWFITGCSRGLGLALARAVLARGDRLVATARRKSALDGLQDEGGKRVLALELDIVDDVAVRNAVAEAEATFGGIDVLVNNAGYGLAGAVEELSDVESRAQFEPNLFGALNLSRAVLPGMRRQGRGHLLQISSIAGFVATPGLGLYNASKFALEGFSEAMAQEVAPFGIRVTIIEPGPFRTDWAGPSLVTPARRVDAYAASAHQTIAMLDGYSGRQPGDPDKAAQAMFAVVDSGHPPLRLPLGDIAIGRMRGKLKSLGAELDAWEAVGRATAFDD